MKGLSNTNKTVKISSKERGTWITKIALYYTDEGKRDLDNEGNKISYLKLRFSKF